MKQALLIASFGTTVPRAEQEAAALERALAAAAPGWTAVRAYTSGMVRRVLARQGRPVDSPAEALAKLQAGGAGEVFVQPTHFLRGIEYDKLKAEALAAARAGQVDVALTAATLATAEVEGYRIENISTVDNRGFTLPVLPDTGEVTESGYPIGNDVTCNLEIRQAIAYAIDRQQVAEAAVNGYATPCYSENDGMPWNNPEVAIETDVDYAKQLLADAGWSDTDGDGIVERDGLKAEFVCLYPSGDSVRQAVAMAAAEQVRAIGINIIVEGTNWDDLAKRMFSNAVMMGWGAANPYESYCLYYSGGALKDDYYNPEGYMSEVTDGYLTAAMEALTVEDAYRNWQLAQWDGETGTAMKGECPWVWIVNIDHVYYVRDGLDIGRQQLHPHGASMPLLQNLQDWTWSE